MDFFPSIFVTKFEQEMMDNKENGSIFALLLVQMNKDYGTSKKK